MRRPTGHGLHAHVAWVFDDRQAFVDAAVRFLAEGVRLGQRLLYVADAPGDQLVDDLAGLPDRDGLLSIGALAVCSLSDPNVPGAAMRPEERDLTYRSVLDAAAEDGYTGVRVAIDTTSLALGDRLTEQARWERMGDRLIVERPLAALCGIDRSVLPERAVEHLACLHPFVGGHDAPFALFTDRRGLVLTGEVDCLSADLLADALAATPPGPGMLALDVSRLRFVDGRAFAAIGQYAAATSAAGGTLVLTGARPIVRRLSELLDFDDHLVLA